MKEPMKAGLAHHVVLVVEGSPAQEILNQIGERHYGAESKIEIVRPSAKKFQQPNGLKTFLSGKDRTVYLVQKDVEKYAAKGSISLVLESDEVFALIPENIRDTQWFNLNHKVNGAPTVCKTEEIDAMINGKQLAHAG